ncbi:MAG: DNA-binding protein [Candidatus Pacebacteria bacterium]|nr:DNA-binding protein [Candidatus Paceibacterota bacterium]
MKIAFDSKEKTIVQFEKGDEPVSLLAKLAGERGVSCHFYMIGGCTDVELAYYDIVTKDYSSKVHSGNNIEVINVTGTVGWFEGAPMTHAHGVFSGPDHSCYGGHVNYLHMSATGETIVEWLPEKLKKETDEVSGLKLFCTHD